MTFCQAESQTHFDHQPPQLTLPDPDPIRIYVACLAAYGARHNGWRLSLGLILIWGSLGLC